MRLEAPVGTEVLRVRSPEAVSEITDWVHDAYLEDAVRFSVASARAVIPFGQESGWEQLHSSMADPKLVKTTLLARHYEVPLTRCYLVVEHAQSLEVDIDWADPVLLEADFSDSTLRVRSGSFGDGVSVSVSDFDVRLLVTSEEGDRLYRRVLRVWPVELDRWLGRRS